MQMRCGIRYSQSFVKTVLWIAAHLGHPQMMSWSACSQCAGVGNNRQEKECSYEAITNKSYHGNAAQRAGSVGDCGCAPALAQHGQVIYPQAPGLARNASLRPMREHILSADRSARKTVLLGQMPYLMVERPSGANQQESILHSRVSILREGVRKLWQQKSKILFKDMLSAKPGKAARISIRRIRLCGITQPLPSLMGW